MINAKMKSLLTTFNNYLYYLFGQDLQENNDIPAEAKDHFILSGYRPLNLGFGQTFRSLLKCHNETFNIWTHLFGLLYFLYWFCDHDMGNLISGLQHERLLPVYAYFAGICLVFAASSGAHWFNSVSLTWHNVCFMVDYSGISFYGSCTTIAFYYYNYPTLPEVVRQMGSLCVLFVLMTAILAMWVSCVTRVYNSSSSSCHMIKTYSFAVPFVVGNILPLSRSMSYLCDLVYHHTNTNVSSSIEKEVHIGYTEAEFCYLYSRYLFYIVSAALINAIKLPECKYPRNFDIIGQSHQWFHILIFMGIRENFWLTVDDIRKFIHRSNHQEYQEQAISLNALIVCYVVLIFSLISILVWYGKTIRQRQPPDKQE